MKMRARSTGVVAAAAVAGLVAVGCGSSSPPAGSGPATTSPTTTVTTSATGTPTTVGGAGGADGIDPAIGVATTPVTSHVQVQQSTFEGHVVYSYVPAHPTGLVFLFHGSHGGADFAKKVETTDVLNELTDRGYGFVATDSTERTGLKQWDIDHTTTATNPDLARLSRLRTHLVDTTGVDADTPVYGIGMSNGSAFVSLWATVSTAGGQRVAAIGMYEAGVPASVRGLGGVKVPTFMVVGVNDTVTLPAKERADLARIGDAGVATELHEVAERRVLAARYLRIPGVTPSTADAIVAAYRDAGVVDAEGRLDHSVLEQLTGLTQAAKGLQVRLPAGLTPFQRQMAGNETLAAVGEHQFNAEFKRQNADFFDAHR